MKKLLQIASIYQHLLRHLTFMLGFRQKAINRKQTEKDEEMQRMQKW